MKVNLEKTATEQQLQRLQKWLKQMGLDREEIDSPSLEDRHTLTGYFYKREEFALRFFCDTMGIKKSHLVRILCLAFLKGKKIPTMAELAPLMEGVLPELLQALPKETTDGLRAGAAKRDDKTRTRKKSKRKS